MHPLLVALNAKYIHTNTAVRLLKANASHHIDFMEFTIKDNVETIVKTIIDKNPLFVGFSVYIWNVTLTQTIIHTLKEKADIPIILGGPEVSYDAAHFLDHWPIDGVIKGEGEKSMDALVAHYSEGAPLEKVPNLSADGIENPIEEIENLHQLSSPHFWMNPTRALLPELCILKAPVVVRIVVLTVFPVLKRQYVFLSSQMFLTILPTNLIGAQRHSSFLIGPLTLTAMH